MSRFTTSILLATALLGVLLWIVLSIVIDLASAPEEPLALPAEPVEIDPSLPRWETPADIEAFVWSQGLDPAILGMATARWFAERGFGFDQAAYADIADTDLLKLAARGDVEAAYELAERSLREFNSLAAIDWYEHAAADGSLYAMMRIADLLSIINDPWFESDPEQNPQQDTYATLEARGSLQEQALAWELARIVVGGYPMLGDMDSAQRLVNFSAALDQPAIDRACELAQTLVLETAAAKRARGGAVFSAEPPAMAITVAQPEQYVPCSIPVLPLVSLAACEQFDFVDAVPNRMTLWICEY